MKLGEFVSQSDGTFRKFNQAVTCLLPRTEYVTDHGIPRHKWLNLLKVTEIVSLSKLATFSYIELGNNIQAFTCEELLAYANDWAQNSPFSIKVLRFAQPCGFGKYSLGEEMEAFWSGDRSRWV